MSALLLFNWRDAPGIQHPVDTEHHFLRIYTFRKKKKKNILGKILHRRTGVYMRRSRAQSAEGQSPGRKLTAISSSAGTQVVSTLFLKSGLNEELRICNTINGHNDLDNDELNILDIDWLVERRFRSLVVVAVFHLWVLCRTGTSSSAHVLCSYHLFRLLKYTSTV